MVKSVHSWFTGRQAVTISIIQYMPSDSEETSEESHQIYNARNMVRDCGKLQKSKRASQSQHLALGTHSVHAELLGYRLPCLVPKAVIGWHALISATFHSPMLRS